MDSLWALSPVAMNSYFNFSLVLIFRRCQQMLHLSQSSEDEALDDVGEDETEPAFTGLSEVVGWLFGVSSDETDNEQLVINDSDDCEDIVRSSFGGSASAVSVFATLTIILSLFIFFFIWCSVRTFAYLRREEQTSPRDKEEAEDENTKQENVQEVTCEGVGSETQMPSLTQSSKEINGNRASAPSGGCNVPVIIRSLHTMPSSSNPACLSKAAVPCLASSNQLLTSTISHLQSQLDWVLGVGNADQSSPGNDPMSAVTASLATPRLSRKGSIRRPRWRAPVSLLFEADSPSDKSSVWWWQKVEDVAGNMNWTQVDVGDLDVSAVQDNRLSAVLQFYQQMCPVPSQHWTASCLIVNYTLTLLHQELLSSGSGQKALQFVDLRSFGSASNGTCILRADRFNVMLVVEPAPGAELTVYHTGVCDDIPAGKLVLGVKEASSSVTSQAVRPSQLFQKDHVGDIFGIFLSWKEASKAAHKMLSDTMEKLKLKNKTLLDRLPFTLQLDQYNELQLCIDTRMLNGLGLGLSKITISFTPSVRVSAHDSDPLPVMYAVPPWKPAGCAERSDSVRDRLQSRIMRNQNQGVAADLLWQLEGSEVTSAFMSTAQRKISTAGHLGCQVMCQQILRALFSRSAKDVLLTLGEVHPHVLDTVVCFLLLESSPESWSLSCLPDRLSDCVHFLRSAVQSAWMPGFAVHNPHLLQRMPALQLLPLLSTGRQENILANVGPDATETILAFIDSRLQETGLRRCLKDEFSTEMWEYEFFIFG